MIDVSQYIGIPFCEKGRSRAGTDCWGAVLLILKAEYGIRNLPDFRNNYEDTSDQAGIAECIDQEKQNWKEVDNPQEGAIIIFNVKSRPHHVGICTGFQQGKAWFFHVHKGSVTKHERLSSSIWNSRINSIYVYC